MRKHAHVDAFGGTNEPVQWASEEAIPPVHAAGMADKDLRDPMRAREFHQGFHRVVAVEGGGLPVTVKLRSGWRAGETDGIALAHRLVAEAGVAAIALHPRPATIAHRGSPDYALAAELVRTLDAPVLLSGGLQNAQAVREAYAQTDAAAVMLARGALGNPWLFEELLGRREQPPGPDEVLAELDWIIGCASRHLGVERAGRYLRRFYPWYVARLRLEPARARVLASALQQVGTFASVREALERALDAQLV